LAKARDELGELVRRVSEDGELIHLSRRGRTVATLISPERLASLEAAAADFGRLAEVSQTLITTLDVHTALRRLARVMTGWLGDVCVVDLVADEGWECVTVAAVPNGTTNGIDPAALDAAVDTQVEEAVLPGPRRIRSNDAAPVRWAKMLVAIGATEGVVTPLTRGGRLLGALMVTSDNIDDRIVRLTDEVARRASVVVDNARLYAEQRTVAERFQNYLLADLPTVEGLTLAARYASAPRAAEVGGDWYDAFALPDGSFALVIGDVMGHDLDAAVHMSQLRNLLRAAAWLRPGDPATIASELDRICSGLDLTPEALATLVIAILRRADDGTWLLRWANAGHLAPLLIDGDGDSTYLERPSEPLLCIGAEAERTAHEMELQPRSTLLLYTDGLIERRAEDMDRSAARLRRWIHQLGVDGPEQLCDALIAEVGPDHDDDIALLAVRVE
jgi:serine phosphatase RsbU (regulator of sigma subunit)/antitoxin (DNA-binding transcriptional repressor) of toxin-antitoxin stability system